jgi:hypothetical protein
VEINEIEQNKNEKKINKTKSWFFGKTNKTDKFLARLIRKTDTGKITRTQYKQFCANVTNLDEIDKFLKDIN